MFSHLKLSNQITAKVTWLSIGDPLLDFLESYVQITSIMQDWDLVAGLKKSLI